MVQINSIMELKLLLKPLLEYKKNSLKEKDIFITEDEIFSYFANKKWKSSNNLHLCDIVDDVLNLEITELEVLDK